MNALAQAVSHRLIPRRHFCETFWICHHQDSARLMAKRGSDCRRREYQYSIVPLFDYDKLVSYRLKKQGGRRSTYYALRQACLDAGDEAPPASMPFQTIRNSWHVLGGKWLGMGTNRA
jgi:hypothetical protein